MANSADGAAIINLACDRFADFSMPVTINNDLTGATFEAEVRLTRDSTGLPAATMTISAPSVVSGVTTFTLSLAEATMATMPAADQPGDDAVLYWDLKMVLAGKRTTLFRGTFTVIAGVTQP